MKLGQIIIIEAGSRKQEAGSRKQEAGSSLSYNLFTFIKKYNHSHKKERPP